MWPKALAQLIELAPHIGRLVPLADRFFQSKTADQEASRSAMEQMAEGLRGDLGQVTASHAGLYRQLNDQSERLSALGAEMRAANASMEELRVQMQRMEEAQRRQQALVVVTLVVTVLVAAMAVTILVVGKR